MKKYFSIFLCHNMICELYFKPQRTFRSQSCLQDCNKWMFCPMCPSQLRDMKPQDKTDIRSILVSVGLLLAPDEFQMVLDADNTSKGTDFKNPFSIFNESEGGWPSGHAGHVWQNVVQKQSCGDKDWWLRGYIWSTVNLTFGFYCNFVPWEDNYSLHFLQWDFLNILTEV